MAKSAGCFRIRDPTNHGNGCLIRSRNTMDSWETLEKHPLHADRMDSKWSVKTVCFWDLGPGLIKHSLTSDTSFWNTISYQFLLSNLDWAAYPWNWFTLHGTNISHLKKKCFWGYMWSFPGGNKSFTVHQQMEGFPSGGRIQLGGFLGGDSDWISIQSNELLHS